MIRPLLLLLLWFGLNAGEVGLPRSGTLDGVGVNIHFTHAKPGELEMLAAGGFRVVRMDFVWEGIEREKGVYDLAAYDHLMADLDRLGLRAYFILDYGHRLYDGGLSPHTDDGRAAFCAFVKAAMQHYVGRGIIWEMWNEPNITFWKPKPNAGDYAKLALAVGETIRDVTPKELFVGPTTSEIDLTFMETCFTAGCLSFWDAVSVHPYRHQPPETVADDYRSMRSLIRRHRLRFGGDPRPDPPILSGEWGYSSSINGWGAGYDEVRQGQYLPRQWLTNIANGVPISIWYDWHDDGTDPKEAEHNFGTVRHAYREGQPEVYEPKPAYRAAKTLTTVLNGYEFSKALALKDDEHVLLFAKGDQLRLAAWTSADNTRTVTIPASAGRFRVTGHLGKELPEIAADEKGLTLTLTGDVQYLAPIDANPSLRLAVAWERVPLEVLVSLPPPTSTVTLDRHPPPNLVDSETMCMALELRFTNPLERPVQIGIARDELAYNHSLSLPVVLAFGERTPEPQHTAVSLNVDGRLVWTQRCTTIITNPLSMRLLPPITRVGNQTLAVMIDNTQGTGIRGEVTLLGDVAGIDHKPRAIQILAGEMTLATFPLSGNLPPRFRLGARIAAGFGTNIIRALPELTYQPLPMEPAAWSVHPDGDAKVASTQHLTATKAEVIPGLGEQEALDLDYHLDKGWKFLRIAPTKPIDLGAATEIGMWVFSDGSGNVARLRVTDASGQTFQPDAGRLNFTGWKWLTFAFTPHTAHWGGANDGVVKAPLKLDTLFLLDQADQSRPSQGTIRIAGAMAVE